MVKKKIRAVVAEDSIFTRKLLVKILESDPEIEVVGTARNGAEAVELVRELRPDIVTMDIRMPVMNGFQATQRIMAETPTPILVISSSISSDDLQISFNAIQAGALEIMEKPKGSLQSDYLSIGHEIIRRVKMISEIKVFRHLSPRLRREVVSTPEAEMREAGEFFVAIGASTGGPSALHEVLQVAEKNFPGTIFVTQHISEGFGQGCVEWLNRSTALTVKIAEHREPILPGVVYFAPDRGMIEILGRREVGVKHAKNSSERLNIDFMMKSAAENFGHRLVGVLLTGMGNDGVEGLRSIKENGGKTLVQNEETSIVFGMPRAAIEAGVADLVLPLNEIYPTIMRLAVGRKLHS